MWHGNLFQQFMNLVGTNSQLTRTTRCLDNVYLLNLTGYLPTRRLYLIWIKIKANRLIFLEFLLPFL